MTKFAVFDQDGLRPAFYSEDIHGARLIDGEPNPDCSIPPGAVEISDADWRDFVANPGLRRWVDGALAAYDPPPAPATTDDVNRERQRRVIAGKVIDGVYVTGRDEDARNLTNLALAAQLRIGQGDTTTLTIFRDGNNVDHDLTPPQMLVLWQQSAAYVSDLYTASWQIKAMDPLPADVTDDALWPAAS